MIPHSCLIVFTIKKEKFLTSRGYKQISVEGETSSNRTFQRDLKKKKRFQMVFY